MTELQWTTVLGPHQMMGNGHRGRKFQAALSMDRAFSTISGHQSVNDECFTACCDLDILAFEVIPRTTSSFF